MGKLYLVRFCHWALLVIHKNYFIGLKPVAGRIFMKIVHAR